MGQRPHRRGVGAEAEQTKLTGMERMDRIKPFESSNLKSCPSLLMILS
jgi:hypothetical protein